MRAFTPCCPCCSVELIENRGLPSLFPRLFTEVKFKVRSDYPLPGRVDDGPGKKFKDKSTREDQKKDFRSERSAKRRVEIQRIRLCDRNRIITNSHSGRRCFARTALRRLRHLQPPTFIHGPPRSSIKVFITKHCHRFNRGRSFIRFTARSRSD